jgi:hypothetical protein
MVQAARNSRLAPLDGARVRCDEDLETICRSTVSLLVAIMDGESGPYI